MFFNLDSDFLSRGLHLLTVLFTYLIITFMSALVLKKGLKIMSRLSNKYLILVPIINIILNVIYITNQYFDFFTELDLVGNYFSLLKLDNDNIFCVTPYLWIFNVGKFYGINLCSICDQHRGRKKY